MEAPYKVFGVLVGGVLPCNSMAVFPELSDVSLSISGPHALPDAPVFVKNLLHAPPLVQAFQQHLQQYLEFLVFEALYFLNNIFDP